MSPIPLVAAALLGLSDQWLVLMVPVLLLTVAGAVSIFIKLEVMRDGFLQLLKKEDSVAEPIDAVDRETQRRKKKWAASTGRWL